MAALAASRSVLNVVACVVNTSGKSKVERCSFSANSTGSLSCAAAARVLVSPPTLIPFQPVEEEDDIEELTFLDYDDDKTPSTWLTPQYLSLRLRSSSLMMQEASDALKRHFKGRQPATEEKKSQQPSRLLDQQDRKPIKQTKHRKLNLISENYSGNTVEFIGDVIIADTQEEYFTDLTMNCVAYK